MLIHALRRTEPTTVELFGLKIEFKPNEHRHCVAEVTHAAAIHRLLSIREGYAEYASATIDSSPVAASAKSANPVPSKPALEVLLGSDAFPAEIDLGNENFVTLARVVQEAQERSELDLAGWNALAQADRDERISAEVERYREALKTSDEDDDEQDAQERADAAAALKASEEAAAAQKATADAGAQSEVDPLVLVNEKGEKLDLNKFTAKQVREFASTSNIELPSGNSTPVAELRLLLAKGLRGE